MTPEPFWLPLLPLLPAAAAVTNLLVGRLLPRWAVAGIACLAVGIPFLIGLLCIQGVPGAVAPIDSLDVPAFTWGEDLAWLDLGDLRIPLTLRMDALSAILILVITGVGFLIHVYSVGYMEKDPGFARYFAYLNLFVAFMLVLVLADHLVLLFLGWEGVGLCSYLLIGFWFTEGDRASAGFKAFLVNRVGDAGMLLGMALLWSGGADLTCSGLAGGAFGSAAIGIAALLFLLAVTAKSAQIPLHVWLPDAMAGPTPVSALIHAATMVTAGIYLVARLFPMFEAAPMALPLLAALGAGTLFGAGVLALGQNDCKKVLAYSTISQLGYMALALGCGAVSAAIFHLVTHAFFKALLFLAAGSLIHAMHGEQDLRKMGGLARGIPLTAIAFVIGALGLSGVPPLAGFWSKEGILAAAWSGEGPSAAIAGTVALAGALLTALYTARLYLLAFHGEPRGTEKPHESPMTMILAMGILAALTIVGGALNLPESLTGREGRIDGMLGIATPHPHVPGWILPLASIAVAAAGWFAAIRIWTRPEEGIAPGLETRLQRLSRDGLDLLYQRAIARPARGLSTLAWVLLDRLGIDGTIQMLTRGTLGLGRQMQSVQVGRLGAYTMLTMIGAICLLLLAVRSW